MDTGITQIQQQITANQRQQEEVRAQIRSTQSKLDELQALYTRVNTTRADFETEEAQRLENVGRFSLLRSTSRVAKRYQDGMTQLITGNKRQKALDGFESAMRRVQNEVSATDQQLKQLWQNLHRLQEQEAQLRRALNVAMQQAASGSAAM